MGLRTALILAATGLVVYGGQARPTAASQHRTLVVGESFAIRSLDPGRTLSITSLMVNHSVYDSLVTFDGEDITTPKPSLATEWTVSGDRKTYTFKLRPNVRFTSGNPLTSVDVKWSLERAKHLKNSPAVLLDWLEEVLAPDTLTVVLRLKTPRPALLAILASPGLAVLDSKLVAEKGGDASPQASDRDKAESFLNNQSAGTGAYILTRYSPELEVVLIGNPNHWRGAPKLDRIVLRNIPEPATQKLQVERGDLDLALALDQDQIAALRSAPGVTVRTSLAPVSVVLHMNNDPKVGGAFANPKVQEAVRNALDYDGIMALAGPGAVRLAGFVPTGLLGALEPREAIRTDRERAKALLREANLPEVKGTITYAGDRAAWGADVGLLAQKIQADLAAVVISISLNGLPRPAATQLYRDGRSQIGLWSWTADFPDASTFLAYVPGRVVGVRVGWPADASPAARELGQLAREAEVEVDPGRRMSLHRSIQQRLTQIGPYAPLFQPAVAYAFRSNVQGVTFHGVWGVDFWTVSK